MKHNLYIQIDGNIHQVFNLEDSPKLKKGMGYIKDGFVYIFKGKIKDGATLEQGSCYSDKAGNTVFNDVADIDERQKYSITNIINFNGKELTKIDNADKFIEIDQDVLDSTDPEIFAPLVKDTDDILKRIVKQALNEKQIDIRRYRKHFEQEYDLTNLKASLTKPGTMSIKYFNRWCEILGLNVQMVISDNGADKLYPLKKKITFDM